jgi:hypothetical protein
MAASALAVATVLVLFWLQNFGVLLVLLAVPVVMLNGLVAAIWGVRRRPGQRLILALAVVHVAAVGLAIAGMFASMNAHIEF